MMAGIEQEIAAMEPGAHACMAYVSAEEHKLAVAAFLREGLRRGERAMYIADAASRDPVCAQLHELGMPVDLLREQKALVFADVHDLYLWGPDFDPREHVAKRGALIDAARDDGFNGFRWATDAPADIEQRVRPEALLRYEAGTHELLRARRSLGLCAYDRRSTGADLMMGLLRTHPVALLGGHVCGNPFCDPPAYTLGVVGDERRVDWMINQILRNEQNVQYQRAMNEALLREATSLAAQRQRLAERVDYLGRALEARDLLWGMVARRLKASLGRLDRKVEGLLHDHRFTSPRAVPDPQDAGREELDELRALAGEIEGIAAFAAMQVALKREPLDLAAAIRAAVSAFRAAPQRAPMEVNLTAPESLPGTWDRRRTAEVVSALLAVASDHSWGTPLEMKLEQLGAIARITVRFHALEMDAANTGGGGSAHGHSLLGSSYDRLAMELWTTRELVRLMGGTFGISGRADGDVTFTVDLPRADEEDAAMRDLVH
jgi:signal transduction histidine kinase